MSEKGPSGRLAELECSQLRDIGPMIGAPLASVPVIAPNLSGGDADEESICR